MEGPGRSADRGEPAADPGNPRRVWRTAARRPRAGHGGAARFIAGSAAWEVGRVRRRPRAFAWGMLPALGLAVFRAIAPDRISEAGALLFLAGHLPNLPP